MYKNPPRRSRKAINYVKRLKKPVADLKKGVIFLKI